MQSWHRPIPPPFEPGLDRPLPEAVAADAESLVVNWRELPEIGRYARFVDPVRDVHAARTAVLAAFEHAPDHVEALAAAWKSHFPAWTAPIDFAVGVAALAEDPATVEVHSWRLGPLAADGEGRYELESRLGSGSGGLVFRGLDRTLSGCGAPVPIAVKFIPCEEGDVDRRLREAGAARSIADAGVARILDAGVLDRRSHQRLALEGTCLYVVQEFVEGVPLWVWKACRPDRTGEECGRLVDRLREAVRSCHGQGVVHGDLSPANVVVDADGRPRLVDFGRAIWSPAEPEATLDPSQDLARLDQIEAWLVRDLPLIRRLRRSTRNRAWAIAALVAATLVATESWRSVAAVRDPGRVLEATITELFGPSVLGARADDLGVIARKALVEGPAAESDRVAALEQARSLAREATLLRRAGTPDPGLELLVATLFMNARERPWALAYAERATRGESGGDRLEVARAIHEIATAYGKPLASGTVSAVESLGSRLGVPALAAWSKGANVR